MKDANNKAFGANTQRIKGRVKIVPIIDRSNEYHRTVDRRLDFEVTVTSVEDRVSLIQHEYEQALNSLDRSSPYAHCALERINETKESKLATVERIVDREQAGYYKRVATSWCGDAENDMYQHLRSGKARSFQECDDAKSVQFLFTEKEQKVNVKSTKFVGTHILAKAKVSIILFTYGVYDTFEDAVNNSTVAEDKVKMGLTRVIPTVILTDTDSVYLNFFGHIRFQQLSGDRRVLSTVGARKALSFAIETRSTLRTLNRHRLRQRRITRSWTCSSFSPRHRTSSKWWL